MEQRADRQQREERASQPVVLPRQNSSQNTNLPSPQALNKNRTVAHWCVHGYPDKLDSLKDKRQQTAQYIELLS